MDKQIIDRQPYGQTDVQTDRHTDRQTDRQTERHTCTYKHTTRQTQTDRRCAKHGKIALQIGLSMYTSWLRQSGAAQPNPAWSVCEGATHCHIMYDSENSLDSCGTWIHHVQCACVCVCVCVCILITYMYMYVMSMHMYMYNVSVLQ